MFGISRIYFAAAVFLIGFINICASTVSVEDSASIYATATFKTDISTVTSAAATADISTVTSAAATAGTSSTVSEPSEMMTMNTYMATATSTTNPASPTASTSTTPSSTAPTSTTPSQIHSIYLSSSVKVTLSPTPSRSVMASSSGIVPNPNAGATYNKCSSNQNDCKNNGKCYIGSDQSKLCFCGGDFYGEKCEKEANPLYKPLVYALGGATGFLLLVICIALLISCRKSKGYDTGASKDLDNFNNIGLRAKGVVNGSYGD